MKPFQQWDRLKIGIASILGLLLAFLLALNVERLPLVGGGTTYTAHFTEAAGLRPDNEVRIAGVKVGTVTGVELEGDHVLVSFRVHDAWIGDRTTASIRIKTALGQKYLALETQGSMRLPPEQPIPVQRTMSPYDVIEAFSDLSSTVDQIDTRQLAQSFRALSGTFSGTPDEVRGALNGLSALSRAISSRDDQLHQLLNNTSTVSKIVAERNTEFEKLLADGNLVLQEIKSRRDSIRALLDGTRKLSVELTGLVNDNNAQIGPALQQLDRVTQMLQRNQDNLDRSIQLFAPLTRLTANAAGNGRWFDGYICGLLPPAAGPVNQQGCRP